METALASCTECGAVSEGDQLCPRCHRPRWYTLRKISLCLLVISVLAILIKAIATYGDRTMSLWFG